MLIFENNEKKIGAGEILTKILSRYEVAVLDHKFIIGKLRHVQKLFPEKGDKRYLPK